MREQVGSGGASGARSQAELNKGNGVGVADAIERLGQLASRDALEDLQEFARGSQEMEGQREKEESVSEEKQASKE